MAQTVEVRFKGTRRDFYDWGDGDVLLRVNEPVIVEADRGLDFGRINSVGDTARLKCGGCTSCAVGTPAPAGTTEATKPAADASAPAGLRRVVRRAEPRDISQHDELRRGEEIARRQVIEKVRARDLPMRISDAEWQWDRSRLTIFFTAETRVDFRALVRELAGHFRARIELRQIGVRDEAARLGGIGRCGREFCCSTWLTATGPVSLALAKDQHLSLNPAQISGGCGRLLCCLKYEHEFYVAARKRFPKEGKTVRTLRGAEKVVAVDIFRERVFLRSDEHGPRILGAADFRAEVEQAASAPPPAPAPEAPRRDGPPDGPADPPSGRPRRPGRRR